MNGPTLRNFLPYAIVIFLGITFLPFKEVQSPYAPTPPNNPPTPGPKPSSSCSFCDGLGWIGDGHQGQDCSRCDRNGDGNLKDPLPPNVRPSRAVGVTIDPQPTPALEVSSQGVDPPIAIQWLTPNDAHVLANASDPKGRVFTLVSPEDENSCAPCLALRKALEEVWAKKPNQFDNWVFAKTTATGPSLSKIQSFPYAIFSSPGELEDKQGRLPNILWAGTVPYKDRSSLQPLLKRFDDFTLAQ